MKSLFSDDNHNFSLEYRNNYFFGKKQKDGLGLKEKTLSTLLVAISAVVILLSALGGASVAAAATTNSGTTSATTTTSGTTTSSSGIASALSTLPHTPQYNLPLALQESLYFYNAQANGPIRTSGLEPLEWRGNTAPSDSCVPLQPMVNNVGTNLSASFIAEYKSILDPNNTGCLNLSGGYNDAGDTVKFGLPQTYAASVIGWSMYEFPQAFQATNTWDHAMSVLKWDTDYFLRSTFTNSSGNVIAFCYQVGQGSVDHNFWGPGEIESPTTYPRPAYCATAQTPATDQSAGAAAALAVMAILTKNSDPTYSAQCLKTAEALYVFGEDNRGIGYSGGFYPSSGYYSELAWAAVWLYLATGEESYIQDIVSTNSSGDYTGWMSNIIANTTDTWQNSWVMSWDAHWGGVFSLLDPIAQADPNIPSNVKQTIHYINDWQVQYWSHVPHDNANDTNYLAWTPGGFALINSWGSARYNTAAQLEALVYRKNFPTDPQSVQFTNWAMGQMNYLMGDNPLDQSYIVGFSSTTPYVGKLVGGTAIADAYPHEGGAQSSFSNSQSNPLNDPHILWGALGGGPEADDAFQDVTTNFVDNEVTDDYNSSLVGALAGLWYYYGQSQPMTNFVPPPEPAYIPYFATASDNQESNQSSQVTVNINNYAIDPPHYQTQMSARYYFDISSIYAHGETINDVTTPIYYDASGTSYNEPVQISKPVQWGGPNSCVYYVDLNWNTAQVVGQRALEFGIVTAQASNYSYYWNPANSWSYQGVAAGTYTTEPDPYVPVYINNKLVYGEEPPLNADLGCTATASSSSGVLNSGTSTSTTTNSGTVATSSGTNSGANLVGSVPGASACLVSFEVAQTWSDKTGSYYYATITVTNQSNATIDSSPLAWQWSGTQSVMGASDATVTQTGSAVSAVLDGDNVSVIPPGGSQEFGIEVQGTLKAPTSYTLDGVSCGLWTTDLTPPASINPVAFPTSGAPYSRWPKDATLPPVLSSGTSSSGTTTTTAAPTNSGATTTTTSTNSGSTTTT
ncbi:MAG: glycoside hydrolase family 9 protein, partial [Firmicutes bacterium]|nr:glycoside hydrolase family 9 protein [Bacillota bacterium]